MCFIEPLLFSSVVVVITDLICLSDDCSDLNNTFSLPPYAKFYLFLFFWYLQKRDV